MQSSAHNNSNKLFPIKEISCKSILLYLNEGKCYEICGHNKHVQNYTMNTIYNAYTVAYLNSDRPLTMYGNCKKVYFILFYAIFK